MTYQIWPWRQERASAHKRQQSALACRPAGQRLVQDLGRIKARW
jgi:hypothetical protein